MRILIVYSKRRNTPFHEHVTARQVSRMEEALKAINCRATSVLYHPDTIANHIEQQKPMLIFNLAYGYRRSSNRIAEYQPDTAKRLEASGIPLVGTSSNAQSLAQDKRATAQHLKGYVPSPQELDPTKLSHTFGVAKPRFGACHRRVYLIKSEAMFQKLNDQKFAPYLLQEYISGPEFTVGVVSKPDGLEVLPILQASFSLDSKTRPHVANSRYFKWKFIPTPNPPPDLVRMATLAFVKLKMADYARFDFRIGPVGPILLDANSLPNLDPNISILPKMIRAAGSSYEALIQSIARSAIFRHYGQNL